jgi:hypothetical protein
MPSFLKYLLGNIVIQKFLPTLLIPSLPTVEWGYRLAPGRLEWSNGRRVALIGTGGKYRGS